MKKSIVTIHHSLDSLGYLSNWNCKIQIYEHNVVVKLILCVIKVISMNLSNGFDVVVALITLHNFSSRSSCKLVVGTCFL